MPNPLRGEVPITIHGTERLLRYTHDAIARLEQRLSFTRGLAEVYNLIQNPTLTGYQILLVEGLRHKWPKITLDDVAPAEDQGIFDWFNQVGKPIAEAMNLAFFGRKTITDEKASGAEEGAEAATADAATPTPSATPTALPAASDAATASSGG